MAKAKAFQKGDRVAYARAFLRNITAAYYAEIGARRGTVLSTAPMGGNAVVRVQWDDAAEPKGVLDCNLVRADRIHLEPV